MTDLSCPQRKVESLRANNSSMKKQHKGLCGSAMSAIHFECLADMKEGLYPARCFLIHVSLTDAVALSLDQSVLCVPGPICIAM